MEEEHNRYDESFEDTEEYEELQRIRHNNEMYDYNHY